MADEELLGDLHERPDGGFDGWCWSPSRPEERLVVDLLVNDKVVASMVAAILRGDLVARGYGDGRHGFVLRLPPNLPEAAEECLVTARERRSGAIIGRVLRPGQGVAPAGGRRVDRAEQWIAEAWEGLEAARVRLGQPSAATRMRSVFGVLAARLADAPGAASRPWLPRPFGGVGLPDGPPVLLPNVASPVLSVILPVGDAVPALRRIASLAVGLAQAGAELMAVDCGRDPLAALLPGRVRNLRYLRDPLAAGTARAANLAAAHARGRWLVMLGDDTAHPSAAALLALAEIAVARPQAVLFGPAVIAAIARVDGPAPTHTAALPARLGVAFCLPRDQWRLLGPLEAPLQDGAGLECADLAFKAALLGIPVVAVSEPAAVASAPGPVVAEAARRALAAFHARWGAPHAMPEGRHV